jgi:L-ascorbate metabolism protein UlaG (beta-lactamase superfamily)
VRTLLACMLPLFLGVILASAQEALERDVFDTTAGKIEITFIGHGSLMFQFQGKTIHVDPFSQVGDYTKLPKADLILITHDHPDHLDLKALENVRTAKSVLILSQSCAEKVKGGAVMRNGDVETVMGIKIEAVPAYNMANKRPDGQPFHPKGNGNGYILTFAEKRVYVAGDTENTPEMKALKQIDVAFLPMNLPYTMTPEMVADAAKAFTPKVLYPYHFGDTDVSRLTALLKESPQIEVRVRRMK